ncbi:MAG TPA: ABC transporter substrate-binding protein [Rectinemataceae bacterium]|nr:ABC transporter substrate-binding protein [Rectinemataceae bacterium]
MPLIAHVSPLAAALLLFVGCAPSPFVIGVPLVLTGVNSALGVGARNGIELAAKEIDEAGGINGHPLKLIVRDDRDDPDKALAVDKELAKRGATVLVGHMTSRSGLEAIPWCNAKGILLVSPTISSSHWNGQADWFFRVIGSNELKGNLLAEEALRRGYRRAVVFYETANQAFTRSVASSFEGAFVKGGGSASGELSFTSSPDLDYGKLARSAISAKPDLVLFSASAYDNALFSQELAKSGKPIPVFGPMWAATDELFALGGKSVEGHVFALTVDLGSKAPAYAKFRADYLSSYGEEPGFGAVHAYEALMVVAEAARKSPRLDAADIRTAIISIGRFKGLQADILIDANGDCSRRYRAFEARGGAFVPANEG